MIQTNHILQLDPSDERWIAFVESIAQANIFHHPVWINLLAECYGYTPYVITLTDEAGTILAGLPVMKVNSFLTGKRWVSLPFTDYCKPLYCNEDAFIKLSGELVHLYQIQLNPSFEVRWELPACTKIHQNTQFVRHTLNLNQNIELISKSLHRTQRQNIKTAEKNNIRIERGQNFDTLRIFYRLHSLTRRRQGVPVQPWRFFELLYQRLIAKGFGFILLAYSGSQCLAAGLFLHWQKSLIYKYASSNEMGQELRPNHLLTWTALRWGCDNGYHIFDFGRTDIANEGLRTFKNRWGATEIPLTYSTLSTKPPSASSGKIDALMHKIIRNSPISVCRLAGELLYRHFG